jgi:hypothetical protein
VVHDCGLGYPLLFRPVQVGRSWIVSRSEIVVSLPEHELVAAWKMSHRCPEQYVTCAASQTAAGFDGSTQASLPKGTFAGRNRAVCPYCASDSRPALVERNDRGGWVMRGHIRSYYSRKAQDCLSLAEFEPLISSKMAEYHHRRTNERRKTIVTVIIWFIIWIFISSSVSPALSSYVTPIGGAIVIGMEVFLLLDDRRSQYEAIAAENLFETICWLEEAPTRWKNSDFRWELAQRLEGIAFASSEFL